MPGIQDCDQHHRPDTGELCPHVVESVCAYCGWRHQSAQAHAQTAMTAKEFARLKARFPKLRWRREQGGAEGRLRGAVILVHQSHAPGGEWLADASYGAWSSISVRGSTLGRCLRSLECAILREARTLAGMVGKDVTP